MTVERLTSGAASQIEHQEGSIELPGAQLKTEEGEVDRDSEAAEEPKEPVEDDNESVNGLRSWVQWWKTLLLDVIANHVLFGLCLMDKDDKAYTRFERLCNLIGFLFAEAAIISLLSPGEFAVAFLCDCVRGEDNYKFHEMQCNEVGTSLYSLPSDGDYRSEWFPMIYVRSLTDYGWLNSAPICPSERHHRRMQPHQGLLRVVSVLSHIRVLKQQSSPMTQFVQNILFY